MRSASSLLLLLNFLAAVAALGQSQMPQQSMRQSDGGVRETLDSISIPPMANAPFTATLQTEWVRAMSDGGTITLVNERKIARDSKGRIYEERWGLVPKSMQEKSMLTAIRSAIPLNIRCIPA